MKEEYTTSRHIYHQIGGIYAIKNKKIPQYFTQEGNIGSVKVAQSFVSNCTLLKKELNWIRTTLLNSGYPKSLRGFGYPRDVR